MNVYHDAKLKSFRLVESVCTENQAIVALNAAFEAAFGEFKTKVARLVELARKDDVPLTGITADKKKIRKKLCEDAANQAGLIYAYAYAAGNDTLRAKVDFSKTALTRLRDEELIPHCRNIHDAGIENLARLGDYGVTSASLALIETQIDAFSQAALMPRVAENDRRINNKNIASLIREINELLQFRMDRLALAFKASHREFYDQYMAAHRMERPAVTHTQLKILITDKATHLPVKNAQVTAILRDVEAPALTAAADTEGIALFKPVSHGSYIITVAAPGFRNYETVAETVMGAINELEAELEKEFINYSGGSQ
jgi:hypothetical protein